VNRLRASRRESTKSTTMEGRRKGEDGQGRRTGSGVVHDRRLFFGREFCVSTTTRLVCEESGLHGTLVGRRAVLHSGELGGATGSDLEETSFDDFRPFSRGIGTESGTSHGGGSKLVRLGEGKEAGVLVTDGDRSCTNREDEKKKLRRNKRITYRFERRHRAARCRPRRRGSCPCYDCSPRPGCERAGPGTCRCVRRRQVLQERVSLEIWSAPEGFEHVS
jgi:hypothetical protein